jgi:hypothetical protein
MTMKRLFMTIKRPVKEELNKRIFDLSIMKKMKGMRCIQCMN